MNYLTYWIYIPLVLSVLAIIVALTYYARVRAREEVFREIKRNKMTIQTLALVLSENKKLLDGDIIKVFEHSKGFLLKSGKDIKDSVYLKNRKYFETDDEIVNLNNVYKSFSVVLDVLSFVNKINNENEIKTFINNFRTACTLTFIMIDKVLPKENSK